MQWRCTSACVSLFPSRTNSKHSARCLWLEACRALGALCCCLHSSWDRDVKTGGKLVGGKFADRWNGSAVLEGIIEWQLFRFPPPSYINESKPELFWAGTDDNSLKCTRSAVVPALSFPVSFSLFLSLSLFLSFLLSPTPPCALQWQHLTLPV